MKILRKVELKIDVHNKKEKVWDLLFNRFGEINVFNPFLEGSHFTKGSKGELGCERQCDLKGGKSIKEKIIKVDDNQSFVVEIIDGGLPMMDKMNATFHLSSLGKGFTRITADINYATSPSFLAGFIKGMMSKMFFKLLLGLKYHLETGQEVTGNNLKEIEKAYKRLDSNESFSANLITA